MAKNMLAIWGRECSFPDLHQQINELIGKNNKQQIHLNWAVTELFWSVKHGFLGKFKSNSSSLDKFGSLYYLFYPISLMLSSPVFIFSNIKIFIESKNTGGIWIGQNVHLSIESAWNGI